MAIPNGGSRGGKGARKGGGKPFSARREAARGRVVAKKYGF